VKPEEPEGTRISSGRDGLNGGEGGGVRWQKRREISRKRGRAEWGREEKWPRGERENTPLEAFWSGMEIMKIIKEKRCKPA
jgi:hypothetical protein